MTETHTVTYNSMRSFPKLFSSLPKFVPRAPKEALAKYVSTTYLTSAKLMGAYGFSAAIAARPLV